MIYFIGTGKCQVTINSGSTEIASYDLAYPRRNIIEKNYVKDESINISGTDIESVGYYYYRIRLEYDKLDEPTKTNIQEIRNYQGDYTIKVNPRSDSNIGELECIISDYNIRYSNDIIDNIEGYIEFESEYLCI